MARGCKTCGERFEHSDGRVKYCEKCRLPDDERRAKALRELRARRAALRKWHCVECGVEIGFRQQRCAEHWRTRRLEQYRRAGQKANYDTCGCGARKGKDAELCRACDSELKRTSNRGKRNPNWRGGRTSALGYTLVRVGAGYQMEHRAVWEAAHGPIPDKWVVHHLNGIKSDNRLENLQAMSRSHHGPRAHLDPAAYEQRIRDLEQQVRDLESR